MPAALKLDLEIQPLSQKPPLGEKRLKPVLVWKNPALSSGIHRGKSKAMLSLTSGQTLYGYVGGNPLGYIDPFGWGANIGDNLVYDATTNCSATIDCVSTLNDQIDSLPITQEHGTLLEELTKEFGKTMGVQMFCGQMNEAFCNSGHGKPWPPKNPKPDTNNDSGPVTYIPPSDPTPDPGSPGPSPGPGPGPGPGPSNPGPTPPTPCK